MVVRRAGLAGLGDVWAAMAIDGEHLLDAYEPPFWGRPDKPNPHALDRSSRRTEREDAKSAKSVFQIGGAGAVGTGSVRGMAHRRTLARHGFSIWPFGPMRWPRVIEIYPRALTGPVNKSSWSQRHAYVHDHFPAQRATLLERAAGSEDAFDAAVSALVMANHEDQLAALAPQATPFRRRGQDLVPRVASRAAQFRGVWSSRLSTLARALVSLAPVADFCVGSIVAD